MKRRNVIPMFTAAALLSVIGAGSTFAYLTAETGTVTNTFTVGNVEFDESLNGGLSESLVERNDNGLYADADGENVWSVSQNAYEDLVAGEVVVKDPTVHMAADSQDAWVFAKIVNQNDGLSITYSADWIDVTQAYKDANPDETVDYAVYAKTTTTSASEHSTIFTHVTVSGDVTEDTEFTDITVTACAVQASGFDSYADAISEAVFQ